MCRVARRTQNLKLYVAHRDKGFEILGVSLDAEKKDWEKAILNDKLLWPQVSDLKIMNNEAAKMYGIASIPQNILIGPDGKILFKNLRGLALADRLKAIFKE